MANKTIFLTNIYELSWEKRKSDRASGRGWVLLTGDSDIIRGASDCSNCPSSSSEILKKYISILIVYLLYLFFDEKMNNELSFGIGCLSEWLLAEVVSDWSSSLSPVHPGSCW